MSSYAVAQREIVGGKEAAVGQHLYVTGLRRTVDGRNFCGGSLIAPNVVLTAAHCVATTVGFVSIGSHFFNGTVDGEQLNVVRQIKHPKYVASPIQTNDFAVLILGRNSKFAPVPVSFDVVPDGVATIVRGWGTTSSGGKQSSVLLEVGVGTVTNAKCSQFLGKPIGESMLCAGGKAGEDSCQGDSGGPLTIETSASPAKVVGVVSWGYRCAVQDKPGVYSRISSARNFIEPYITNPPSPSPIATTNAPTATPTRTSTNAPTASRTSLPTPSPTATAVTKAPAVVHSLPLPWN